MPAYAQEAELRLAEWQAEAAATERPGGKLLAFDGNTLGRSAQSMAETPTRIDLNQGAARATIGVSGSTRVQ